MDEVHTYYWAWTEKDNVGFKTLTAEPRYFRVWRVNYEGDDMPVTEKMSRAEAVEYCRRIVKLTEGKALSYDN
jgi:hypothetical protein